MIRILLVDDHVMVRQGLKNVLQAQSHMRVIGEAGSAPELLAMAEKLEWDVVILDITLPGRSGLDILSELKIRYPQRPVLVLSMHPEDQFAARVLKAGASGYVTKESAPEVLVAAIEKVVAGGKYISPIAAENLIDLLSRSTGKTLHAELSDREFDVLRRLALGQSVSEIASELTLSVKTISTYRSRILEKMGMGTNAQLIRYAMEQGLV